MRGSRRPSGFRASRTRAARSAGSGRRRRRPPGPRRRRSRACRRSGRWPSVRASPAQARAGRAGARRPSAASDAVDRVAVERRAREAVVARRSTASSFIAGRSTPASHSGTLSSVRRLRGDVGGRQLAAAVERRARRRDRARTPRRVAAIACGDVRALARERLRRDVEALDQRRQRRSGARSRPPASAADRDQRAPAAPRRTAAYSAAARRRPATARSSARSAGRRTWTSVYDGARHGRAAVRQRERELVEPVAPGDHDQRERGQREQVRARRAQHRPRPRTRRRSRPPPSASASSSQRGQLLVERQREHEEADVAVEQRVVDAEVAAAGPQRQQPPGAVGAPLAR